MKHNVVFGCAAILGLAVLCTAVTGAPARSEALVASEHKLYLALIVRKATACLTTPTLMAPADGATVDTLMPTYEWDNGDNVGATGCSLEVATDESFQDVVLWRRYFSGQGIFRTSPTEPLSPGTTHFWRVRLMCGATPGPWSDVWSFTTGHGVVPDAPRLTAPPNGATVASLPVTLQWEAVDGATHYEVALWQEGTMGGYGARRSDTQLTVVWELDPATTYEWRVRAGNAFGYGVWSGTWRFITPAP